MAKSRKYLIETSAVQPAIDGSTAAQTTSLGDRLFDGSIWTSVYIRMEYIRRWFCDAVRVALLVRMCTDLSEALIIVEQDFSPRNVKGMLRVIAHYLRECGAASNTQIASEEIASMALRRLEKFDLVFAKRIPNSCKCKVGALTPGVVDFDRLLDVLGGFYEAFKKPVTDCEVNALLDLPNPKGKARPLLGDPAILMSTVGANLQKYSSKNTWITCKECAGIGDAIIALDQPPSWCIVHVDRLFNELARCLGRENLEIPSVLAARTESQRSLG